MTCGLAPPFLSISFHFFVRQEMSQPIKSKTFLDVGSLGLKELQRLAAIPSSDERRAQIMKLAKTVDEKNHLTTQITTEEVLSIVKMSWFEEFCSVLMFGFGVPGAVVSVPILTAIASYLLGSTWKAIGLAALLLTPLALFPVPFVESSLTSWPAVQILRYFSFKVIFAEQLKPNHPTILVAPPHGVFPFGNIITMIAFPSIMGYSFRGLAASAALATPIFRQYLATIGVIDAAPKSAHAALSNKHTIGISTGGVAEVFETKSESGNQVVVLKSRKGIIKLAFKTGADLVPCYLFGNTELLSLWTGGTRSLHNFFCSLSRTIGFALIVFWGRFGLPIPYRVPILGVMGVPIPVQQKDDPSQEEIDAVHELLLQRMVELFDEHKHSYGWGDKQLIIN